MSPVIMIGNVHTPVVPKLSAPDDEPTTQGVSRERRPATNAPAHISEEDRAHARRVLEAWGYSVDEPPRSTSRPTQSLRASP
jgi:hypothetical protein